VLPGLGTPRFAYMHEQKAHGTCLLERAAACFEGFTLRSGPSVAQGQVADEPFVFEVPPAPGEAEPRFTFDVHTGFAAPLNNRSLCPAGAGCVLKSGGGVGGTAERRWPVGLGVLVGYDLWFLDTDSVYELGVQQSVRLGLRYTMPTSVVFHPVFELSSGVMVYGDTFRAATVGGFLEGLAGSEFELSAAFGLRAGLGVRVFSHTAFRTERDGVLRGKRGAFSETIFLRVGLTFQ
jgi:hypothetical protein